MKNEGYAEIFSWKVDKVEEAAVKVITWYSAVFSNRDTSRWGNIILNDLLPSLRRKVYPHTVLFPGEDFALLFRPSDMVTTFGDKHENMSIGIESDPHFVFMERAGGVIPRVRTSFIRANQDIGLEAEEVLGALYQRFPPTITLPRTKFAEPIYSGKITMFDYLFER